MYATKLKEDKKLTPTCHELFLVLPKSEAYQSWVRSSWQDNWPYIVWFIAHSESHEIDTTAYFPYYPMCATIKDCNIYSQYIVHFATIIIRWTLLIKKTKRKLVIHLSDSLTLLAYIIRNLCNDCYSFTARQINYKWEESNHVSIVSADFLIMYQLKVNNSVPNASTMKPDLPISVWLCMFLFEIQLHCVTFTEQT